MRKIIAIVALILLTAINIDSSSRNKEFKYIQENGNIYNYCITVDYFDSLNVGDSVAYYLGAVDKDDGIKRSSLLNLRIDLNRYKEKMGYLESRGRYDVKNRYGYLGKYQFSKTTLKIVSYINRTFTNK